MVVKLLLCFPGWERDRVMFFSRIARVASSGRKQGLVGEEAPPSGTFL